MKRKLQRLLLTLVTFFLSVSNGSSQTQSLAHLPNSQAGTLDLRQANFSKKIYTLEGKWKFYWQTLKSPSDTTGYFEYIDFPKLWKNSTWKNQPIPSQGYATYEITILLPKTPEPLAVTIPDMYCAYELYANGASIAKNGITGTSKATTKPYWSTETKTIESHSDTLQLLLQISNFDHVKGGASQPIEIGLKSKIEATNHLVNAFDYFLTGCIFMGGFFFLGLYLFGQHDKSILYFSLFCLFYSYRIVGSRQYALHSILPDLDWYITIHFEYLSLFLAVAFFALYTRYLYPKDAPQKVLLVMAGICFGFALVTVFSPPIFFSQLIDLFMVIVLIYIAIAVVIYWRAAQKKRVGARYALVSTGAIFIIVISIIIEYYDIVTPFNLILFAGYLVFFSCQSLILTFRFAYTLKKAKEEAELGLKVKSEFLSTMSHEIRTPLNSVIGMTHFMIKESPRPDQKEHLDVLLFSANNLLSIVNDVLDFSTIEEGKIQFNPVPVDISTVSRNILAGYKAVANNNEIDFILDLAPDLPTQILTDQTRLSQIIGNLVNNAVKFTNKGFVKLQVTLQTRTESEITLRICVEDTGIGIAPEKQQMIFDRFTQADSSTSRGFSGTGLGLAICKRILELQGVELQVSSELGKGSSFFFVQKFPVVSQKKELASIRPEGALPLSDINILIVEDNPLNVRVLQNFLKRWGAVSDVAQNGQEALDLLDASRHHVVLMDLHMPVMDGYEATKRLRDRGETIPIIALTASVALDIDNQVLAIGINEIVVKPFVPDHLLQVIRNHIDQNRQMMNEADGPRKES
jgi:signal transduction histidine kinase/CheY-like chemotaxis protein